MGQGARIPWQFSGSHIWGVVVKRLAVGISFALVLALSGLTAGAAPGNGKGQSHLQMYTVQLDASEVSTLVEQGFDIAAQRDIDGPLVEVDVVLTRLEKKKLQSAGYKVRLWRNADGLTATQLAVKQAEGGYTVWRSWDEEGGIEDEIHQIADNHPDIVKLVDLGDTYQGRDILALKVTKDANSTADGSRPGVLYSSAQHAREWISVEVNRRILHYFVGNYGDKPSVTKLVNNRELWFILVANPDGYQYTFDVDRLWRKNLRDNDNDDLITNADGVDPNRNFAEHWRYDEEGSSSDFTSETYRGPSAASEPETQAMQGLLQSSGQNPYGKRFAFQVNYHSFGNLLLYTFGWQVQTPSTDDPIFVAMSGADPGDVAIPGFNPGVGADLYTTNGETTDYAHAVSGTLAWTPELGEGQVGNGFEFPDSKGLVRQEFTNNLPFALDVARSAADPDDPVSHIGGTVQPFYPDKFKTSYGDPQTVQVNAKRDLNDDGTGDDAVTLHYKINGGGEQTASTSEWNGGERYGGPGDVYYHKLRGTVTGAGEGDDVTAWFTGGGKSSDPFTYHVESDTGNDVLVLAAEDYTGLSPKTNGDSPSYLDYYLDALDANGVDADVYDVDAHDRTAPHPLGVLSHYKTTIWYTGDNVITRDIGQHVGTASRLTNDEMLAVRDYMNEDGADGSEEGDLLYTGKYAGYEYAFGYEFDPRDNSGCNANSTGDDCVPLSDDFLQYYLGAYRYNDDAGTDPDGNIYDITGTDTPFEGTNWSFNGADSAQNQDHSASFLATSSILEPDFYSGPFDTEDNNWPSSEYDRPGAKPYEPHTGDYYMFSQVGDVSYKRLTHTISVPGSGANVSFWTSYDTEQDWDFVMVEAHTVGEDNWTTLPDLNGHTSQDTGDSCPEGWHEIHPFLEHYQSADCGPTGTTGEWNADSGNSNGWQQWEVDLADFAGDDVELSLTYVSDWAVQGLGAFVDDIEVSTGEGTTGFETGTDGWTATGPPEGNDPNPNNWVRTTAEEVGYDEGATISAADSIYFGFGFEGISDAAKRNTIMDKVMDFLND
jgi:hypothetical protein